MGRWRTLLLGTLGACLVLSAHSAGGGTELTFRNDARGAYASYRFKKGDTVWTDVVRRFTSRTDAVNDAESVKRVLKRSGIADATTIRTGTEIKIPVELVAANFRAVRGAAAAKPLAGVVVILDPGHGGVDPGAGGRRGVYEDEVVYDIVCRAKRILEQETAAAVYVTLRDKTRGYAPTPVRTNFPRDRDEYIQTTPVYQNLDSTVGLHLRWYLANSLYRAALRRGTPSDKVIFTSFHADDLSRNARGAMVYVPGAALCKGHYSKTGRTYRKFAEVRERPEVAFTKRTRERSEQRSRELAGDLLAALRTARVKVFSNKPVRDRIVRRRAPFVPAVLRYNAVPAKVLIECGNLNNARDRQNLGDPTFRERVARAYVEALIAYTSRRP